MNVVTLHYTPATAFSGKLPAKAFGVSAAGGPTLSITAGIVCVGSDANGVNKVPAKAIAVAGGASRACAVITRNPINSNASECAFAKTMGLVSKAVKKRSRLWFFGDGGHN